MIIVTKLWVIGFQVIFISLYLLKEFEFSTGIYVLNFLFKVCVVYP